MLNLPIIWAKSCLITGNSSESLILQNVELVEYNFEGGIMDDVDEEQSTVVLYHSISYGFLTHSM